MRLAGISATTLWLQRNRMSRFTYCLNLDQPLEAVRKQIKHYAAYQKKNAQRAVSVRLADAQALAILVEAERELAHAAFSAEEGKRNSGADGKLPGSGPAVCRQRECRSGAEQS